MKHPSTPSELVIDLLLPAVFASRYRARLTALSRLAGQLRLAFCPSVFRSGVSSCPANVTLVVGSLVMRLRGVVEFQATADGAAGQIHFDEPLERREFDALCDGCRIDAVFADDDRVGADAAPEAASEALDESSAVADAPATASLH